MLIIRLRRAGKKKQAFYRIVVTEHTSPPQGKFLEILGFYNPLSKKIEIKEDRIKYWIEKGAQRSDTINNLLCKEGFLPKSEIIKKTVTKKKKKQKEEKPEKPAHIETPQKKAEEGESLLEEAKEEIKEEKEEEKSETKEKSDKGEIEAKSEKDNLEHKKE